MMEIIRVDLTPQRLGDDEFHFVEVEFVFPRRSPFALARYAIGGERQTTGLRLDTGKSAFIDHLDNPRWEEIARKATPRIMNAVQERSAFQPI